MSFIVREVKTEDVAQLVELAKQFVLLNLPGEKRAIACKIEKSIQSFSGALPKHKAEYLFVMEDLEEKQVVGSSLILSTHGSEEIPHSFFKVIKKNHFSEDLGIGFIHQVLRFQVDTEGPTEIGGLLVDRGYRRRSEKLGRQISLARFNFMGMYPDCVQEKVLCELTPPLTDDGRSEFWEALGRRFTGLPYMEADLLSQSHKEFISSLFPKEDIYLCLLDAKARTVLGRVGESTRPAQHLLESIGFKYLDEVDPFDGGPHYGCRTKDIFPIKHGSRAKVVDLPNVTFKQHGLLSINRDGFKCIRTPYHLENREVSVPAVARRTLEVEVGDEVFVAPFTVAKEV